MRIAELAHRAGVKVSALRFYERSGLLPSPPRSAAGYRVYDEAAVERIRYLRRGQELGFRLQELRDVAIRSGDVSGDVTGELVHDIAVRKLADIDAAIADLTRTRAAIEEQLADQCTDRSTTCPIVSTLANRSR